MKKSDGVAGASMSFRDVEWRDEYRTSAIRPGEPATDILREFYIPVLERSARYDRVAGYFRSSSLAAASQGFTAFARNGAKARFLVGCDLDVKDVKAALTGADEALVAHLTVALENDGSWTSETIHGVDLFAYLVSMGVLEIKVAFRIHKDTGNPLSVESNADGYVHEKWAVFVDGEGDVIRIDGSLNESKTALSINAENVLLHCSWWDERSGRQTRKALADFEHLWRHGSEGVRVMALPDAVKARLIRMGKDVIEPKEIDDTDASLPSTGPDGPFEALAPIDYLRWCLIKDGPRLPGGRFVGIETAPVVPWPHQTVVARRLVTSWPHSFLLCDEVGLGKTIEAGLAIRSLTLSGIARRVLIASPASLTRQWQREMKSKFLLDFARTSPQGRMSHERLNADSTPFEVSEGPLLTPDLVIASTGLLTHRTRRSEVRGAAGWDIALVDEAHCARAVNKENQLYTLINDSIRPKARSLLLATATPMQLVMQEAFDLMKLTGRVGSFGLDDDISQQYYEAVQEFVRGRGRISDTTLDFLRRAVLEIKLLDSGYWTFIMSAYRSRADQRIVTRWVEDGRSFSGEDYRLIARVLRAAAPLSRVMLRHTRDLLHLYQASGKLDANLAERHVRSLDPINFSPTEKRVYGALEEYCRDLDTRVRASASQNDQRRIASVGFYLSFLRLRFASSLHAIQRTLERRIEKVTATLRAHQHARLDPTDDELAEAVFDGDEGGDEIAVEALLDGRTESDLLWEQEAISGLLSRLGKLVGIPSKLDRLLSELDARRQGNRIRQTVVFTRFKDTLDHLVDEIRSRMPRALVGTFSGAGGSRYDPEAGTMIATTRLAITQGFVRGDIDVLLCTDAAAEGLNLQTADLLINFDLPWNPAKVEQRIGRIDRIGQKYQEIFIANYAYAGSAEERVYGRLLSRLTEAGLIVGPQQIALLPVTEADFRALEGPKVPPQELQRIEGEAKERLKRSRATAEVLEIPPKEMQEFYRGWERSGDFDAPITLNDIEVALKSLANAAPSPLSVTEHPRIFALRCENGQVIHLTADRDLYDKPPRGVGTTLEFASYGAPAFEHILEMLPDGDLSWMRRVSASDTMGDNTVERAGFSVGTQTGPINVLRAADLRGIEIDPSTVIEDPEIQQINAELTSELTSEICMFEKGLGDVDANQRASAEQLVLSHEIAAAYIETGVGENDADDLHRRLRDELIPNRPNGLLVRMRPARIAHRTPMLSKCSFQGIQGDEINVPIPPSQLKAAEMKIDNVIREMRRQGAKMSRDEVASRLRRRVAKF